MDQRRGKAMWLLSIRRRPGKSTLKPLNRPRNCSLSTSQQPGAGTASIFNLQWMSLQKYKQMWTSSRLMLMRCGTGIRGSDNADFRADEKWERGRQGCRSQEGRPEEED
ncbi:hypothetical protein SASPL_140301 [Salvia splendens]|uniref:Uncharacterized protein n=1 Tax=Salvia splendens TaxID=180675 RepID=A0A8X8WQ26_SALSN|nr:hypothetical protein SASPL_140301 [Salvia splendens]